MNEITAITPQVKDKTRCNIYIDGRFYCGMSLETTIKNRLKVGQIVKVFVKDVDVKKNRIGLTMKKKK